MTRQTRREFLENSMLAATDAAMAGSGLVPQANAQEQSSSPNERLRVAVVGLNGRGQSHLGGFMPRQDCEVVAVCDADELVGQTKGVDVVEKATEKRPAFYADLRKLLEDKSIDIVTIATPNHWHSLAAIWAMQAGKDVYVEKPVSHNVSEGRRVVDAARKLKKICQTGTQSRIVFAQRRVSSHRCRCMTVRGARRVGNGTSGIGIRGQHPQRCEAVIGSEAARRKPPECSQRVPLRKTGTVSDLQPRCLTKIKDAFVVFRFASNAVGEAFVRRSFGSSPNA
jgi:hypothetical protein